ncbi:Hypothetical protein D9617_19g103610 [Elsinoe fawcettii]|nr:Hypothetical protein D9617_19g103610 [Elsinoe fawcettii]
MTPTTIPAMAPAVDVAFGKPAEVLSPADAVGSASTPRVSDNASGMTDTVGDVPDTVVPLKRRVT